LDLKKLDVISGKTKVPKAYYLRL